MTIVHAAALSTRTALEAARADLHTAVQMSDDEHRRQQYARSARDSAAEVLLDPGSTPLELGYARGCFDAADALITRHSVTRSDASGEPS
ncbi:hypothetical protein [Mycolicibacterium sp. J2]|uniref:hypothetical protein n=1 Tax=Mycolicibacterium sp. J2 TaxID=2993511 RepID=UPI00224AC8C8|nr:hypothetical protein [Mycolicibacterium sp. J2]MCX2715635.1 hypothetical protein [Mycolicibacterium sp. J2]